MAEQFLEAATIGLGTVQYAGTPANLTFAQLLAAALPAIATIDDNVSGFDLQVVSGTLTATNDGTAATATSYQIDTLRVRNAKYSIVNNKFRFFSGAAVDVRIMLWG